MILTLALAVAREGEPVGVDDPDVVKLSNLLRSAAVDPEARFRNPHGVARKLWTFAALLDGSHHRPLSPAQESVWRAFIRDPGGFEQESRRAATRLTALAEMPSRGPVPSFGTFALARGDRPSVVYAILLDGIRLKSGAILIKIGRTNQMARRQRELNSGFPCDLGIRWTVVRTWAFANANAAHQAEQLILQAEAKRGRSAGGEFIRLDPRALESFLDGCTAAIGMPPQGRRHADRARRCLGRTSGSARHRVQRQG